MPVGPYDTFDECVADNQDKDDPGAFCAWLKEQTSSAYGKYDDIDFSPPAGAREEAQRGLEWRREYGRGGTDTGVARARDIANGSNLSPDTVRRMLSFFARHEGNKAAEGWSPGEDGYPSAGRIAWALWGGDPGWAWARKVVGQMDARDNASVKMQAEPGGGELPDAYRPASADDVPEGRNCANCVFYDDSTVTADGEMAMCTYWAAPVRGDHYCDAWQERAQQDDDTEQEMSSKQRASFETVTDDDMYYMDEQAAQMGAGPRWEGVIAVENEMTGDGRMFESGAMRWETLPVPLRWAKEDEGEHLGAIVVGRVDEVYRDGDKIMGRGVFDAGSPEGMEAARQVAENLTPGVSVDLDDVSFEVRVRNDLLGMHDDEMTIDEDAPSGMTKVLEMRSDDEVMVTTDARLRALTMVATPAFADARIYMVDDVPEEMGKRDDMMQRDDEEERDSMYAGAGPVFPPSSWYRDPQLQRPTGLTVLDDGRVYGHLATWGTCHTGFVGECVEPPSSATNYAYFRTGAVRTADGETIAVGRLTVDTTHAGRRLGASDTAAHYEHSGVAVADVAAGEDVHGIWVAGALRPGVTDEQIRVLQASPLSGDWRRIGGNLELVAALAVNSPGFPIPRALVASGAVQALQASGVVQPRKQVSTQEQRERILDSLIEREMRSQALARKKAEQQRTRFKAHLARAKVGR